MIDTDIRIFRLLCYYRNYSWGKNLSAVICWSKNEPSETAFRIRVSNILSNGGGGHERHLPGMQTKSTSDSVMSSSGG